jgi:hypothetical protein
MFRSGRSQILQLAGKRTEKSPSAVRRRNLARVTDEPLRETIVGPATAFVAWPARIRSSLLLKTASSYPCARTYRRNQSILLLSSIAAIRAAKQRSGWE